MVANFPALTGSSRVLSGIPWSLLSYAATRVLTLLTALILARILGKESFGLVGMALLAISALNALTEMGLANTVVLQRDLSQRAQGSMLTLLTILGAAGASIGVLTAPLVAIALGDPRVESLMQALAVMVLLSGPTVFIEGLMRRDFVFKRHFVCSLAAGASQLAVGVGMASTGFGIWSIVGGQLAYRIVLLGSMLLLSTSLVRPAWDVRDAMQGLRSGGGFLAQSLIWFVGANVDYIVVGRAFGAASFGLYSMAYRLAELPMQAIANPVARVTYPAYTALHHRGEDPTSLFLRQLRYLALVACPCGFLLSATAGPFSVSLLGREWADMAGVLTLLALWGAVEPLQNALTWWFNGLGLQKLVAVRSMVILVPSIGAFVMAAASGSLLAIAAVILLRVAFMYGSLLVIGARRAQMTVAEQARAVRPALLGCFAAWPAARGVSDAIEPPALALAFALVAGLGVYVGVVRFAAPGLLSEGLGYLRRSVRRRGPAGQEPQATDIASGG